MWKVDLTQLRGNHLRAYCIRFMFGGSISVLATLIAQWTTDRIGGIFTAFPAILLASLTLINREEGIRASVLDAQGAVLGSLALILTAIMLSVLLGVLPGVLSLVLGLGTWLFCSGILYLFHAWSGRLSKE